MMAIPQQVARVLGAKDKQRIEVGTIQSVLGSLQPLPQHPLRVESRFPIDWYQSNVRHAASPLGEVICKAACSRRLLSTAEFTVSSENDSVNDDNSRENYL